MKKVLVLTYSQSGQLEEIVANILKPFQNEVSIHHERLKPVPDFPFPWQGLSFYDAMPECVEMIPSKLQPFSFNPNENFDLVILGYPIWFLSPPIPLTTFLKSEEGKKVLNGKPVVTIIGSRNMWVMAQEEIKKMIVEAGGKLKGNISLFDRHNNLVSVVTIIYWMTTGKKDKLKGIFPKPGISDEDIEESKHYGLPILNSLKSNNFEQLQGELLELKAVDLNPSIVSIEQKGKRIFKIWAKLILKKGGSGNPNRISRLKMFKYYLLFVIFAVSPLATIIFYLTYPLFYFKIKRKMQYYKGISLK
ncbi:MAG TPA: hypothetical protein VIN10_02240 [Bacteroidales bacterium]